MEDVLKCYKVLDLTPGVSAEEVRKAYIELAHVWHPDRFPNNPILREKAREKMREVEAAYGMLKSFLPELNVDSESVVDAVDEPTKVENRIEAADRDKSLGYAIGVFLALVIIGVLVVAVLLSLRNRAVPVNYQ